MIEFLNTWLTLLKNKVLGVLIINNESPLLRKRPISNTKFDKFEISSDEDSECGDIPTKKRRLDPPTDTYIQHWSSSTVGNMSANWFKPRVGFSNCFDFTQNPRTNASKGTNMENKLSSSSEIDKSSFCSYKYPTELPPDSLLNPSLDLYRNSKHSITEIQNGHKEQQTQRFTSAHHKNTSEHLKYPKQNGITYSKKKYKRGYTAQQCIRLEERECYRQFLKCYAGLRDYSRQNVSTPPSLPSARLSKINKNKGNTASSEQPNKGNMTSKKYLFQEKLENEEKHSYTERILNKRSNDLMGFRNAFANGNVKNKEVAQSSSTFPQEKITAGEPKQIESDDDHSDNSVIVTKVELSQWRSTIIPELNPDCSYISPEWLQQWKQRIAAEQKEKKLLIEKAEKKVKMLRDEWSNKMEDLELDMREQLRLSQEKTEILKETLPVEDAEEEAELLPELTTEMEEQIDDALRPHPPDEVLVEEFHLQIRRRDMETLQDQNWLNDEVINFYMNMLMERGKQDNMPSVYACNTFFYPKLISGGHGALKRWTRKIDIFSHDIMLVPVHLGVHWCLAVINFKSKTLKYYDSMGGKNNECLHALCEYLKAESLDKKKQTFGMTDWIIENAQDIPQQMNSSDCGMFACKYAEYLTRNSKITFKQEHMPYFRRRMVYEIITKRLM